LSGSRPIRYELAVEIARPPGEVWAYLADPTHLPEWQADVEEVRNAPGGPLGEGATFTEVRSFLGKRAESTLEVTTAEPGRELSLATVSGPVQVSIRHRLEPTGEGTHVLVEADADAGKLFGLGGPLLRRAAERRARSDFERLKAVLEGDA
jgi:carbon monoxide dehydrogenase subunit G